MGFSKAFRFPEGLGLAARYQMAVDSVSPVFSVAIASTARILAAVTGGAATGNPHALSRLSTVSSLVLWWRTNGRWLSVEKHRRPLPGTSRWS